MSDYKTDIPDDAIVVGMDDYEAIAENRQVVSEAPASKGVGDTLTFIAVIPGAETDDGNPCWMPAVTRKIIGIQQTATLGPVNPLPVLYSSPAQCEAVLAAMRSFAASTGELEEQEIVRDLLHDLT